MRTRSSMRQPAFDYEAEMARHMCAGCNKAHAGGRILTGYFCTMRFNGVIPRMHLEANECPMNYRRKRLTGRKVLVGQQKQGRF
jgi:hypothetical protein